MRLLIATVGLLAVAGVAAAATTQPPQTLSRSTAPVDAVVQDGGLVAWLSGGNSKCNAVHVLSPDGTTQALPQQTTASMTCHWDLSAGQPQLALAAGASAAIWTLHENGSVPYDYVMEAQFGGKEQEIDRLGHESDGTGWWLGGVAGAGDTLAYSAVDVEYVDPLGCASGGSCKKKIAAGGIQLVSGGHATALLGSSPALDLAVSAGRIAFVEATTVDRKSGAPAPSRSAAIEVTDAQDGTLVSQAQPVGFPLAIALSARMLAVLTRSNGTDQISWYDAEDGVEIGSVGVPGNTALQIAANDHEVVFRVGRTIRGIALATGQIRILARATTDAVGLSIARGRLVWADNSGNTSLIQALILR